MNTAKIIPVGGYCSTNFSITIWMLEEYFHTLKVEPWIDIVKQRLDKFEEHQRDFMILRGNLNNPALVWPILASVELKGEK